MRIHEQIYTSARKLLEPGQSDLGVIAESAGFPRKTAGQLGSLASYRMLDEMPIDDLGSHPARICAMPREEGQSYSVSRIVFAGADHTGRTTPLAHHVVIAKDKVADAGVGLPQVIRSLSDHFVDRWDQPPERFDPPRTLDVASTAMTLQPIGAASTQRLANVLGWLASCSDQWLGESNPPIVFVLPSDQRNAALRLLAAICSVIPSDKQSSLVFVSHVVSANDLTGRAGIVATYPKTEYLAEIQSRPEKRRPTIIDLTDPAADLIRNSGFARWCEEQLAGGASTKTLQGGLTLHHLLRDLDEAKHPDGFENIWRFYHSVHAADVLSNVAQIGVRAQTLSAISPSAQNIIDKWTSGAIKRHFEKHQAQSNWDGLLSVVLTDAWPDKARKLALSAITRIPEQSFPHVLADKNAMQTPELVSQLNASLEGSPALWEKLLQSSPQTSAASRRFMERRVVSGKVSLPVSQDLTRLLLKTGNSPQQLQAARLFLTSPSHPQSSLPSSFQWLQSMVGNEQWLGELLAQGGLPEGVSSALQTYLQPPEPAPAEEPPPINANSITSEDIEEELRPSEPSPPALLADNGAAAINIQPELLSSNSTRVRNPKPLIGVVAIILGIITALRAGVLGFGYFRDPPISTTPLSTLGVGLGILCLVVALIAFRMFGRNRNPKSIKPLMIFGFLSVLLMVSALFFILYSFLAPDVHGAG